MFFFFGSIYAGNFLTAMLTTSFIELFKNYRKELWEIATSLEKCKNGFMRFTKTIKDIKFKRKIIFKRYAKIKKKINIFSNKFLINSWLQTN